MESSNKIEKIGNTVICKEVKRGRIDATMRCNNRCRFCLLGDNFDRIDRPFEEVKRDIDLVAESGVDKLVMSGAEPTIYPRIIEAVAYAHKKGIRYIQLISNGRMFYYADFAEKIVKAGLNVVTFSIHGNTRELHDYLTGSKGALDQLTVGVRNLQKYPQVSIDADIGLFKPNCPHLPEIVDFIINTLGIRRDINFVGVIPSGFAMKNAEEILPDYKVVSPYIKEALALIHSNHIICWVLKVPLKYLEGFEQYKEDSEKMIEEMIAMQYNFQMEKPVCKGAECDYCKFTGICKEIFNLKMQIAQKKCLSVVIKSGICTNSCIFCNEYFFKKSTADVKKMIDDAEKIGANQVLLKGAFTEMPAIIDYAKQRIGTVSISVPSSEYNALFNNGLDAVDEVRISIHDCSPSINDIIAGKNGSFEETRNFLVKITEKKHSGHNIPKIAATIVITRKNFKNLDNTLSFLDDFAIDQYIISFLNPHSTFQRDVTIQNGNRVRDRHGILLKYKEVIPAIDSAIQKYGSKIVVKNVPACFLETFDLHISSESQVNMDYLEDNIINPVSFMRICERELKEQSLVCEACKQSQSCKGIFERHAKIHGLSEIRNAQKNKQISSLTNG